MPTDPPSYALVLAGGNALGAYHAGAYQALHEAGTEPDWIAGASVGAIIGALIAGNPPERRLDRLRAFWSEAAAPDWLPWPRGAQWAGALQSRLLGRPALFHPRMPTLTNPPDRLGVYDTDPLRRQLERLIDFDRLNSGTVRLSVLAVDLESGAEVIFDNTQMRIEVEHLMASSALIPDFPPVRISDQWLVDGGMAANLPAHLVLGTAPKTDLVCFLVDLLPLVAPLPRSLLEMSSRQTDLMFALQTERNLLGLQAIDSCRPGSRPRVNVIRAAYNGSAEETTMKSWDYSHAAVTRRWDVGFKDIAAALARFRAQPPSPPGLTIHPIVRA